MRECCRQGVLTYAFFLDDKRLLFVESNVCRSDEEILSQQERWRVVAPLGI